MMNSEIEMADELKARIFLLEQENAKLRNRLTLTEKIEQMLAAQGITLADLALGYQQIKLTESQLIESEDRYRRLVEGSPAIVYIYSNKRGGIYWSARTTEILGYTLEQLQENPFLWNESINPDDKSTVINAISIFSDGKPFDIEYRAKHANGQWIWLHDRSIGHYELDGEVLIEGLATDITQRKQTEIELQQYREHLETLVLQRTAALNTEISEHKKTVESLRASEELYRQMFDGHSAVKLIIDPAGGGIVKANHAASVFYGHSCEVLHTMNINQINMLQHDVSLLLMQKVAKQKSNYYHFQHRIANGEIKDVEVYTVPIQLNGRLLLYSIIHDITERTRIEKALVESESRYRTLAENFPNGALALINSNMEYITMNGQALKKHGFDCEKLIGQKATELFPEFAEEINTFYQAAFRGENANFEIKYQNSVFAMQAIPIYEANNQIKKIIVVAQDITERKQAEIALRDSELRYERLVNNSPDAVLAIMDGKVVFANPAAATMFGVQKSDDLIGVDPSKYVYPDYLPLIMKKREQARSYANSYIADNMEIQILSEDGATRDISAASCMITFHDKTGTQLVLRDITDRKKAEKELQISHQNLKELNATKDKFFRIIAHDLRSPYSTLLGFTDLLIKNLKNYDYDKIEQFINTINTTVKSSYALIENLLTWARSQTGALSANPGNINLKLLVTDTIIQQQPMAERKKILLYHTITCDAKAYADDYMIRTILRNLTSNAIKYTKQGGEIKISATENDGFVALCVADNGVGIKPENKELLFRIDCNPTTKGTEYELGTGLGLILCKDFIEKNSGTITFNSEFGKGSEFIIKIPKQ